MGFNYYLKRAIMDMMADLEKDNQTFGERFPDLQAQWESASQKNDTLELIGLHTTLCGLVVTKD